MKNTGIYILTNNINGKQYVGKDSYLPKRLSNHLNGHSEGCPAIHKAIQKHGRENFSAEIIAYPNASQKALAAIEIWKISQLQTKSPNGYNLTYGGDGISNLPRSEETKKKLSEANKGNPPANKGSKLSKETKDKISKNNIKYWEGKTLPIETRKKMSETHKTRYKNKEERKKQSDRVKKYWSDPEKRKKQSKAFSGQNNPNSKTNRAKRAGQLKLPI